jgi:hypothetical protein
MPTRVIVPPAPFMTPADIPGSHAPDDAGVAAMIAAVVAEIDGPAGTLGRCLGPQTLEMSLDRFSVCGDPLICPPVIPGTVVVKYLDVDGALQTFAGANYGVYGDIVRLKPGLVMPTIGPYPYPIVIQYQAGYNGTTIATGGTGPIPPQAKHAVVMGVQHLVSMNVETLFLRAEEVQDIGRFEYTVSEQAGNIIRTATGRLLASLKVRRV